MSNHPPVTSTGSSAAAVNQPVILRMPWLLVARTIWLLLAALITIILVTLVSRQRGLLLLGDNLSESYSLLFNLVSYPTFSLLIQWGRYAVLAVYNLTALLIFWRKSDEWMGLITSLLLLLLPFWFDLGGSIPQNCCEFASPLGWVWPLAMIGLLLTILFLNIFPSGRFLAGWWRRLFWFGLGLMGFTLVVNVVFGERAGALPGRMAIGGMISLLGLGVTSQVYRYARLSGPVEQQQTRWVVATMALITLWLFAIYSQTPFRSWSPWAGPWALLQTFGTLFVVALLPLSIARAILRHHLWDVDIIVRKTLVYTLLTGFLLLVYLISIVVLQGIFSRLTGQDSTLATILSTLLIAVLFLPVRRRVQTLIDRRFYRRKYDAAKVLEGFAATARDETDLDRLTAELARVIQETMEPESVSVWLMPARDE